MSSREGKGIKPMMRKLITLLCVFLMSWQNVMAVERITYYHNDITGSPVAATDANGNLLWTESYQPYGAKVQNSVSTAAQPIAYTGKVYDDTTGLMYFGARYYDPVLGRFTGMDPQGFDPTNIHSFNRYAYGNNNPYVFVDRDGRDGEEITAGAIALRLVPVTVEWGPIGWAVLGTATLGWIIVAANSNDKAPQKGISLPTAAEPTATPGDPNQHGNDNDKNLSKEERKSIRSLEKRIEERQQKIAEFKNNPTVRPGMENQPEEVIKAQQEARIKHLESEIETFQNNINKIRSGASD